MRLSFSLPFIHLIAIFKPYKLDINHQTLKTSITFLMAYNPSSCSCFHHSFCLLFIIFSFPYFFLTKAQAAGHCRTSCGTIPISYPFGIDDGCGSPYYRHILVCSDSGFLELRTPSGRYQVRSISYSDPHMIVTDPFMWSCQDGHHFRATRPFSLDTSTHLTLATSLTLS